MNATCKIAFLIRRRNSLSVLLIGMLLVSISACVIWPKTYTDETMQPLAATASDLARAVMHFAKNNPEEAASLDDQELVRQATAFDPKLLKPYKGFVVRGTVDGVILVCTCDGRRGLFEDAECTDKVDRPLWPDENAPCQFTLNPRTVCP